MVDKAWLDNMQKKIDSNQQKSSGNIRWVNSPKKANIKLKFRLLPEVDGDIGFARLIYKHYNLSDKPVYCMNTFDEECPLCVKLEKFEELGIDVNKYKSSGSAYFNAQVLDNSEYDPGLAYLFRQSDFFLSWLIRTMGDPDMMLQDLLDPIKGNDIITFRKRDNGAFERQIIPKSGSIAKNDKGIQAILDSRYTLKNVFKENPTDEIWNEVISAAKKLDSRFSSRLVSSADNLQNNPVGSGEPKTNSDTSFNIDGSNNVSEEDALTLLREKHKLPCIGSYKEDERKCIICPIDTICIKHSKK